MLALVFATQPNVAPHGNKIYRSPDHVLKVRIIPVGNKGFRDQESRVEVRRSDGRLLRWKSFASEDGQHGRGVNRATWTNDGRFFVFNAQSSGGHQPWNWPVFFYSRRGNRFYSLDDFIGPVTSDFTSKGDCVIQTARMNFDKKEEAITVRLDKLIRRSDRKNSSAY